MAADAFALAVDAHTGGDLSEAERLYRLVLRGNPRHLHALTNLGAVHLQRGQWKDGVKRLEQSLKISAAQPAALNNLGGALRELGRLDQALTAYGKAIALKPDYVEALANRARLLEAMGRLAEAADAFGQAAAQDPGDASLPYSQALLLRRLGRPAEAIVCMTRVTQLAPAVAEAHNDLGVMLDEAGRRDEALEAYGRALQLRPDYPEALNNRGVALNDARRFAEGLEPFDAAVALKPDYAAAWFNRAASLAGLGRIEQALASCERAVQIDPAYADAWVRAADMLGYLGRVEAAMDAYARAVSLDPANVRARWNPAMLLLRHGRYAEGLDAYEWRWKGPLKDAQVQLPRPVWLGGEPIAGKTLLIHAEQGHGDSFMMLRYAPVLARAGARVILNVQEPLETLAAEVEGVAEVISYGRPLPPYDLHIPMMSLPLALGARPDTLPREPYLRAPPEEREAWRTRLGPRRRPRVGLVWSGSATQSDDHHRSIALERLGPLFELEADLFSLQVEVRESDRAALAASPLIDLGPELKTYADTAAAMEEMDLVISVCTSAANLAGGLGRPVFVLLSTIADWRWGLAETSPWHPSARLFRQERLGDWEPAITRLHGAAKAFLAGPR
jgi:tetratricopeptide (TPR) repeat protein